MSILPRVKSSKPLPAPPLPRSSSEELLNPPTSELKEPRSALFSYDSHLEPKIIAEEKDEVFEEKVECSSLETILTTHLDYFLKNTADLNKALFDLAVEKLPLEVVKTEEHLKMYFGYACQKFIDDIMDNFTEVDFKKKYGLTKTDFIQKIDETIEKGIQLKKPGKPSKDYHARMRSFASGELGERISSLKRISLSASSSASSSPRVRQSLELSDVELNGQLLLDWLSSKLSCSDFIVSKISQPHKLKWTRLFQLALDDVCKHFSTDELMTREQAFLIVAERYLESREKTIKRESLKLASAEIKIDQFILHNLEKVQEGQLLIFPDSKEKAREEKFIYEYQKLKKKIWDGGRDSPR